MCTYSQVTSDEALAMLLQAETATSEPSPKLRIPAKTTTGGRSVSPIPPWRKNGTQIQIPFVENVVTTDEALSILIHSESVSPSRASTPSQSTPSRDALTPAAKMTPSTLSRFQKVAMKSKVSVGLTAHSKREQDTETTIGKSMSCTKPMHFVLVSTYLHIYASHPCSVYLLAPACLDI